MQTIVRKTNGEGVMARIDGGRRFPLSVYARNKDGSKKVVIPVGSQEEGMVLVERALSDLDGLIADQSTAEAPAPEPVAAVETQDLSTMLKADLVALAESKGIVVNGMIKADIIALIEGQE